MTAAATVISWPATETETSSAREMSVSVPTTTITPQPMTKLPNSSDQRTWRRRNSLTAPPWAIEAMVAPPPTPLNGAP